MVEMTQDCYPTQLIAADGQFNSAGLGNFIKSVNLPERGLSYAVVAIMGPQSSVIQTTKGIWIAKAVGIEPFTIVMDLEGTDGRERGEDDTIFEKQSALFALAVADIVLINMWCHDIGREQAANRPLLKTVFQVMMRLFSPHKTTLLFVIRDKTKTPFQYLEASLREDIQKIWETVPKPQNTPLSDFFNVEVTALSNYEEKENQFKEQVAELRRRFFNSISPGGLANDRRRVVPASGFSLSAQNIWKVIKENKDLDLPSHKIMVSTVRCEEIADKKFKCLASDKDWLHVERDVQTCAISGFGKRISSILKNYLSEYDAESMYFEDDVRNAKRQYLEGKVLHLVYPAYVAMLKHLRSDAFESFKTGLQQLLDRGEGFASSVRTCQRSSMLEFDRGCSDASIEQASWDASTVNEELRREIEAHASHVRSDRLSEVISKYEKQLSESVIGPLEALFEACGTNTWSSIRALLKRQGDVAASALSSAIAGYEVDQKMLENMVHKLKEYAEKLVCRKSRQEAGNIRIRMKDRFATVFNHDKDSIPRVWTGNEDIRAITKEARCESVKLLSAMAAVRLDERIDNIETVLLSALVDRTEPGPSRIRDTTRVFGDPLASSTWEEVPPENTLITPLQCKALWKEFKMETEYTVIQAITAQETYQRGNSWLPPPWVILAMIVLGFNELMLLLRNPLYLVVIFVMFLLGKAIWAQIDVTRLFQNGIIAGLIALSTRFLPSVMNILGRLAAEGHDRSKETTREQLAYKNFRNQKQQSDSVSRRSSIPDSSVSFVLTETG
ncbi:hypothetical protein OROHE_024789 [Orobanche hederae]